MCRWIGRVLMGLAAAFVAATAMAADMTSCLKPEVQPLIEGMLPFCEREVTSYCLDEARIGREDVTLIRHHDPTLYARLVSLKGRPDHVIDVSRQFALISDSVPSAEQASALQAIRDYLKRHEPTDPVWSYCLRVNDPVSQGGLKEQRPNSLTENKGPHLDALLPLLFLSGVFALGLFRFRPFFREEAGAITRMEMVEWVGLVGVAVLLRASFSPWVPLTSQGIEYTLVRQSNLLHYLAFSFSAEPDVKWIQWINLVFSSVTCVSLGLFARLLGVRRRAALLAGALWAVWPYSLIYATSMRPMVASVMLLPWTMAGVYLLVKRPSVGNLLTTLLLAFPYLANRKEGVVVFFMAFAFGYFLYQEPKLSIKKLIRWGWAAVPLAAAGWAFIAFQARNPGYWLLCGTPVALLFVGFLYVLAREKQALLSRLSVSPNLLFSAGLAVLLGAIMISHRQDNSALPLGRYLLGMEGLLSVAFVFGMQESLDHPKRGWIGVALMGGYLLLVGCLGLSKLEMPYNDQQEFRFLRDRVAPILEPNAVLVTVLDSDSMHTNDTMSLGSKYTITLHKRPLSLASFLRHPPTDPADPRPVYFYAGLDTQAQFMSAEMGAVAILLKYYPWELVAEERYPNAPFDYDAMDLEAIEHPLWPFPSGMPDTVRYRLFRLRTSGSERTSAEPSFP